MDYSERGPCCDYYNKIKINAKARIKVLHLLLGGNPRRFVMAAENFRRNGEAELMALGLEKNKTCPCHEAPDPQKFREFFAFVQGNKPLDVNKISKTERFLKLNDLAEDFLKKVK